MGKKITQDPLLVALAANIRAWREYDRLWVELDELEAAAKDRIGPKPWPMVKWRGCDMSTKETIDGYARAYLARGEAEGRVEHERTKALAGLQAARREEAAWYKKAGLFERRRVVKKMLADCWRERREMSRTVPTTLEGARALLAYVAREMVNSDDSWHRIAVRTAVKGIANILAAAEAPAPQRKAA